MKPNTCHLFCSNDESFIQRRGKPILAGNDIRSYSEKDDRQSL